MNGDPPSPPLDPHLVFVGRLTEEDVVWMAHYQNLLAFRRPFRWLAMAGVTLFAGVGIWWSLLWENPRIAVQFLLIWIFLVAILPLGYKRYVRYYYRKHEEQYLETRVCLGDERITIENESFSSSYQWKLFGFVVDTAQGLMFFGPDGQAWFFLPERLFEDLSLREEVLDAVADHEIPIRYMS